MINRSRFFANLAAPLAALALAGAPTAGAFAQAESPVLFTVGDRDVTVEEFDYIYSKTNADSADYSLASLTEYLDLYKRFKLKVAKARALQLDTVPALNQELAGYRRQLTDAYLVDAELTEPLARELHERRQEDVELLHIAVALPTAPTGDTAAAYAKISSARQRVAGGEDWEEVAGAVSQDPSAKANGGRVGYVTAPLPAGLYALETAIYETAVGEVSPVVRSEKFYHIIRPTARRPARGEVEAAHIFVRKPETGDATAARAKIDSVYAALEGGANFDELAADVSEDTRSAPRGGYLGFFGINRYDPAFEDAAFGLAADGDYSAVVETRVGFHVIRRVSRRTPDDFEAAEEELSARVKRMPRYEDGRRAMVSRLQERYGFRQNSTGLDALAAAATDSLFKPQYTAPRLPNTELFSFGGAGARDLDDFATFLERSGSRRIRMRTQPPAEAVRALYEEYVEQETMAYAEERLGEDNPAFYNLMREYEEGILLFEATKLNVWDRAGQDTVGLEAFYNAHRGDYQWGERLAVDYYTYPLKHRGAVEAPLRKLARKRNPDKVLARLNADSTVVTHELRRLERGRDDVVDAAEWKRGVILPTDVDQRRETVRVGVVREVLPQGPKLLSEARGYVIADYQDELEKRWVEELSAEFPVVINGEVLEGLAK